MFKLLKTICFALLLLILTSCASLFGQKTLQQKYINSVNKASQSDRVYSGIYNVYNMNITMLNSTVSELQLDKLQDFLGLEPNEIIKKRENAYEQLAKRAQFFLAFYTPNRQDNNLVDGASANWRFFLSHNKKQYLAKVTKPSMKERRIKQLYPYFSRFHKPYILTFDIPMTIIESASVTITILGDNMSRKISFQKKFL